MFSDKTLVGLGCSHTFGEYMGDYDPITCHERSWVKKLEVLADFKSSVNLAARGGSNYRSERVLLEYLKTNSKDIVVIFSVTDLSRFETVNVSHWETSENKSKAYNAEGAWGMNHDVSDKQKKEFLEYYYSTLTNDEVDIDIINRKVLMLHTLLNSLGIEHYFFEMLCCPHSLLTNQLGFNIPVIPFSTAKDTVVNIDWQQERPFNAIDWLKVRFPRAQCGHFDCDANQELAEYLLGQINIIKGNQYDKII
jgi:hypothetical protein